MSVTPFNGVIGPPGPKLVSIYIPVVLGLSPSVIFFAAAWNAFTEADFDASTFPSTNRTFYL